MRHFLLFFVFVLTCLPVAAQQREYIWPAGRMPDAQVGQIAAMTDEAEAPGFLPEAHRIPYLEWFPAPADDVKKDVCMILISGGAYVNCCDVGLIQYWKEELTRLGVQCVNFVYRTPRPEGLPIYQTAWEDGQRAVRLVRSQAAARGFDPEKIGVVSMSAGSHLALLLATGSLTETYSKIDWYDEIPCHINWAIVNAPAYVTTDGETGTPATREGYGTDVALSAVFPFDAKTCPMSLHHGGLDPYSPNGSTLIYRKLREMGVPAELHLYPGKGHGAFGFERGVEFMRQMGWLGPLEPEVSLQERFPEDLVATSYHKENIWPEGRMPDAQDHQCTPYLEWYIPEHRTTDAIQLIYSGGDYVGNGPGSFEVLPARRYLNAKGIPVVTMKYRTPRPKGLSMHTTAWQDLQRAIRLVRSQAAEYGLDPNKIGLMGSSAGGHLTLMGVTSSRHRAYRPIDALDTISCQVQWGIGIYPAYDAEPMPPEFSFDLGTAPMLFLHGDADPDTPMLSVKVWEKMRAMGIQSELHILATRKHCFQEYASPGTGSFTWLERIADYLAETLSIVYDKNQ